MASWKKYLTPINSALPKQEFSSAVSAQSKHQSWLPEYYAGPPNRLQRYMQYDQMDIDHEINAALNTLAEFSTNPDERTGLPFKVKYAEQPTPTELKIIEDSLYQWVELNDFRKRMFKIFRSVLKYGDQFFIRDPETFVLNWVEPSMVQNLYAEKYDNRNIRAAFIKNVDLNIKDKVASNLHISSNGQQAFSANNNMSMKGPYATGNSASSIHSIEETTIVDIKHLVQVTLTEGMDLSWPFGVSVLEPIYKIHKQKELLEDAVLIYRVHRAPERKIFYIDTGTMPPAKAKQYLERVKNDFTQKRVPSRDANGILQDSIANPLSILDDFYISVQSDSRGSKIDTLPGGENLGCFSLDTKIKLMDGRDLSILEIEKEMKDGKTLWTYSCHPTTGEIKPGLITWAGKTKSNAEVLRLTLDSGDTIVCTPDHKFPILDKGFVEAGDFTEGQSLVPLYFKNEGKPYEMYYRPDTKEWEYSSYLKDMDDENVLASEKFTIPAESINHKVVKIEKLNELMDVGTLTVDAEEIYHDYHTYALSVGVFVKNSIDDLRYFNNKMIRALGVPSAYLPTGPEDGTNTYNDGGLGNAYIQEFRFQRTCQRYQNQLIGAFDSEFKLFLKFKGVDIDDSIFSLEFTEPQNFSSYRQISLDSAMIANYMQITQVPHISKRMALKKYAGWSEEEIIENERMWKEENDIQKVGRSDEIGLRQVGINPSWYDSDNDNASETSETSEEMPSEDTVINTDVDDFGKV